ncbi:MAG: ribosomal L7Ae/L30e/S12e/Gadd45 family protein [Thermoproteota archaeon]|nr:ribosomal L7Ae/L30e/S12e/Gadd45 family protein [Thermoproteota archaeon]
MRSLEKIIKDAVSVNKCRFGSREVLNSTKGSKLIVLTESVSEDIKLRIIEQARATEIPILDYKGNSIQLGKLCNKPFRVSAIALKMGDEEDIRNILVGN